MIRPIKRIIKSSFVFDRYSPPRQYIELLKWELAGKPVPVPHLVKQKTVKAYAEQFSVRTLIETGTYLGTMIEATKSSFSRIFSIELDLELYERAQKRFAHLPHIVLFQGDSSDVLPKILAQIDSPSLFWLDAHYSGGITAKGSLDTPIMSELQQIFEHSLTGHVILIDDAREFMGQDGYPALQDLTDYVLSQSPNYVVSVLDDVIRIHLRTE
ncbi:MAG: hypothetical protein KF832_11250 [Caldilineaceae bacterium]|nr:hypothetical protein [Caldilineaceae bacterium]